MIISLISATGYGGNVDAQLQKIPVQDRAVLELFFSNMVLSEYFGYVLFGGKPIAAAGFDTEFAPEETFSETALRESQIQLGWQTWEKYARFFPSEKFVLRLSKSPIVDSYKWIVLINKETTLECVKNNLEIFKFILGDETTPESVLQGLITTEDIFKDVLDRQDGLLGMLFGYGKSNSIKFQQRHRSIVRSAPFKDRFFHKPTKLTAFNKQDRNLVFVDLPRFAVDFKHPESRALYRSYSSVQVQLSKIYREKQFLKPTLEKFISKD